MRTMLTSVLVAALFLTGCGQEEESTEVGHSEDFFAESAFPDEEEQYDERTPDEVFEDITNPGQREQREADEQMRDEAESLGAFNEHFGGKADRPMDRDETYDELTSIWNDLTPAQRRDVCEDLYFWQGIREGYQQFVSDFPASNTSFGEWSDGYPEQPPAEDVFDNFFAGLCRQSAHGPGPMVDL